MSHEKYAEIRKQEILDRFETPVKAIYDEAGNCTFCGESGRCAGYHSKSWIKDRNLPKLCPVCKGKEMHSYGCSNKDFENSIRE